MRSIQFYALLVLIMMMWTVHDVKAAPKKASQEKLSQVLSNSTIFDLPTNIDEDEMLHETALFMLDNMNRSVDPCEDFYEYSCGSWRNSTRIPEAGRKIAFLQVIQTELGELMVEFLKSSTANDTQSAEAKAKLFFSSCINGGKDISVGLKTLLDNESEQFAKLKLTGKDDWIPLNFMSPYGVYPLLPMNVNYSVSSRQFEISLSLPMPLLEHFHNYSKTEELLQKMGQNAAEFKVMLEYERNLTTKAKELESLERVTVTEFLKLHEKDAIDWKAVFTQAFGDNLQGDWCVMNRISNFTDLERFLRKSPTEHLRKYIKWRTILKFYQIWKQEQVGDSKREQMCRQHTESYMTFAMLPWYIEHLYDVERREDTLKIADSIQTHFFDMISNYTWLDDETKSNVKTKLRAMDISVGYKDDMRHRELSDMLYSELVITNDWFKNLQNLEADRARIALNSVHKTILPPMMSPFSVNAYYADYINTAFITMGVSQMPLYHVRFPASLKFGGIGMLIGHEITHAFDSNGFLVNYDGKRHKWLSTSSLRNFKERYNCLENQYNKFIYRGIQTNGSATMADNIADNAGIRLAYHSYKHATTAPEGLETPLPGMDFTNDQLFFIKFTQTWCTGRDDAYKMQHIKKDLHAYGDFRALGPLRNMPEFAQAFQCKLGSQMNPLKKCVVW